MPTENGLPQYVSKDAKTGNYQYFRRPPSGVKGGAFTRSFSTKDKRIVWQKWPAIHAEAEKHFERLISGRAIPDETLNGFVLPLVMANLIYPDQMDGNLLTVEMIRARWASSEKAWLKDELKGATAVDLDRLYELFLERYRKTEGLRAQAEIVKLSNHVSAVRKSTELPPLRAHSR